MDRAGTVREFYAQIEQLERLMGRRLLHAGLRANGGGGLGVGLSPVVHFRLGRRRWLRDERAINVCNEKDGARGSENAACARGVPSVAAPLGRRASLIRARSSACSMRRPGAGAVVRLLSSPSFAWRNRISIAAKELGAAVWCGCPDTIEAWDLNARQSAK